ncbi:MAG: hypothetical protein KBT68_00035 [bacterium]|nr:hypothetical protein [Candidatus Colisoma equi]
MQSLNAVVLTIASVLVQVSSAATLMDSAAYQWRGGYDRNGDGVLQTTEFVNSTKPKSDTASQTVTLVGEESGFQFVTTDVVSPYHAVTNGYEHLKFPQSGTTATSINVPIPFAEQCNKYTMYLRLKWNGTYAGEATSCDIFAAQTHNWNHKGVTLKIDNGKMVFYYGRSWSQERVESSLTLELGVWYDVFLQVSNPTGDSGTGKLLLHYCKDAGTLVQNAASKWPWVGGDECKSLAINPTMATLSVGGFAGEMAGFGIWPSELTLDEMREVMADHAAPDALWRIGRENGLADEFAAISDAGFVTTVVNGGVWDGICPVLDAQHPTLAVSFDNPKKENRIVRVVGAEDSDEGDLEGYLNGEKIRWDRVGAKKTGLFLLASDKLLAGSNVFMLKHIRGHAVKLDVVEAVGDWSVGYLGWETYSIPTLKAIEGRSYFNLWDGYGLGMNGNWATGVPQESDSESTTIRFKLSADLVDFDRQFWMSSDNSYSGAPTWSFYLNGQLVGTNKSYRYNLVKIDLPKEYFKAGINTIQVRVNPEDKSPQYWTGGARGYALKFKDFKYPSRGLGLIVVVE